MSRPARLAAVAALGLGGFFVVAEVVCGCFPANPGPPTPQQRAEAAALAHLSERTARGGVQTDVSPDGNGWLVVVSDLPLTPGAHTFVRLDGEFQVTEVLSGE